MRLTAEAKSDAATQREERQYGSGILSRARRLPGSSWILGERRSAEAGAGCGMVGGACCAGGALVKGLGIASVASVSSFVAVATPYFIAASGIMMLAWLLWLFRQTSFQPGAFARALLRQGLVMGLIYGVTLAATMAIAALAGISM